MNPALTASTAWTTACRPEPQTRLTVSPGTSSGRPALSAAWRATFMPAPDCSTHPMITSPMSDGATFARPIASRITTAPSSAADRSLRAPPKEPIGVRHALRMTASSWLLKGPHFPADDEIGFGRGPDLVHRRICGDLAENEAARRDVNDRHLRDDHVDDLQARERQRTLHENLRATVPRRVLHGDDDFPGARDEIHRAAHALDHLARDHPVRPVAFLVDLEGAQHRQIDVSAAHHRERLG